MLAFCSVVNNIDQLTAWFAITDFSPYGMVEERLAHFRRGKLAHLVSTNKYFQESI